MSETSPKDPHVVRAAQLDPDAALHISHPFNERSEIFLSRLSDHTGLSHVGVSLARIPPGKESFALHVHSIQEEWIYVLSGRGHVRLDDREVPIGPGDFVGFPAKGPAHVLRNTSDEDLVFLQGGDRRKGDLGHFPELGKIGYQHDEGHMALVDEEHLQILPFTRWFVGD